MQASCPNDALHHVHFITARHHITALQHGTASGALHQVLSLMGDCIRCTTSMQLQPASSGTLHQVQHSIGGTISPVQRPPPLAAWETAQKNSCTKAAARNLPGMHWLHHLALACHMQLPKVHQARMQHCSAQPTACSVCRPCLPLAVCVPEADSSTLC
mmetsp:Transcript_36842/g.81946  ORF Transcript_36842/g.81946 Transcript_36842/m.81946 type:complete len:158 (-) Transcript_36842:346-819(-)